MAKKETKVLVAKEVAPNLQERIFTIRGEKVILDSDLAEIYGGETKILNKVVMNRKYWRKDALTLIKMLTPLHNRISGETRQAHAFCLKDWSRCHADKT